MEEAMLGIFSSSYLLSTTVTVSLILLFIVIVILIACKFKPWRSLFSFQADDIERPLLSEHPDIAESQDNESTVSQTQEGLSFTDPITVEPIQNPLPTSSKLTKSDSFTVNIPSTVEESMVGQTLKRPLLVDQFAEERTYPKRKDINYSSKYSIDKENLRDLIPTYASNRESILMLEVISGPCRGLKYSVESTDTSKIPVTIGRVSPGDVILKDTEVSGKHAMINWNINKLKWELVDMGSLNGTILNSQAVNVPQSGSRLWSTPVDLSSGDIITLGTSSKILINITAQTEYKIPFGVGIASDAMALRRGAKKLPMEDVCYYQWPLLGVDKFGLFGIFDGHGGVDAATSVSKIMPEIVGGILSDSSRREKVLSQSDASDVLREAFYQTESRISHYYEGCTATTLLVWADVHENIYMQCANVGDSACVVDIDGKQVKMTEDHRIVSNSERLRFQALGAPLRDGETRIGGINLARMLGDKFLKEQDSRFSSEPYISEVVTVDRASKAFALLASDGFWDVINIKKAVQLVHQTMGRSAADTENPAQMVANALLNEARMLRTKDNTSIIFLDFACNTISSC